MDELENVDGETMCEISLRTGKEQTKSVAQSTAKSAAFAAVS
jgi:hypothetical protein